MKKTNTLNTILHCVYLTRTAHTEANPFPGYIEKEIYRWIIEKYSIIIHRHRINIKPYNNKQEHYQSFKTKTKIFKMQKL